MAKKISKLPKSIPVQSSTTKVPAAMKPLKKAKVSTFDKMMIDYKLKERNGKKK